MRKASLVLTLALALLNGCTMQSSTTRASSDEPAVDAEGFCTARTTKAHNAVAQRINELGRQQSRTRENLTKTVETCREFKETIGTSSCRSREQHEGSEFHVTWGDAQPFCEAVENALNALQSTPTGTLPIAADPDEAPLEPQFSMSFFVSMPVELNRLADPLGQMYVQDGRLLNDGETIDPQKDFCFMKRAEFFVGGETLTLKVSEQGDSYFMAVDGGDTTAIGCMKPEADQTPWTVKRIQKTFGDLAQLKAAE